MLLELISSKRPYENIDNDVALSMQICKGVSPLEYALKSKNANLYKIVNDNNDLKAVLEACFKYNY